MKEITITKREEGQRFDRFLGKYLPGASSGFLHKMLRKPAFAALLQRRAFFNLTD